MPLHALEMLELLSTEGLRIGMDDFPIAPLFWGLRCCRVKNKNNRIRIRIIE